MPNRVLREVLLTSRKVDRLTSEEFEFYIRLMLLADDFGRFLADPVIVRSRAYPTKEGLKSSQIRKWLDRLNYVGLIVLYRNDTDEYLVITKWEQRTRATVSRYPSPDECQTEDGQSSDTRPTPAHVDVDVVEGEDEDGTAKAKDGPAVKRYGEFQNVVLSHGDYGKLLVRFGERDTGERIERLSGYLRQTGKRYKDHYATILNWARRESASQPQSEFDFGGLAT